MNKQKGQSLVEFTLVLPFFLLLIFCLIYTGMLFYDYSTLSNVARTAAREMAISADANKSDIIGRYYNSLDKSFTYGLVTTLYTASDTDPIKIDGPSDPEGEIVVTINMQLTADRSALMEMVLPENYSIVYKMRKDYN